MVKTNPSKKLLVSIFLCAFFMVNSINFTKGGYAENIPIDCVLESEYTLLRTTDNYTVYYTNNENQVFIYFNFTFSLNGKNITLRTEGFSADISNESVQLDYITAAHANYSLEFSLSQNVLGSYLKLEVDDLKIELILMNLHKKPNPPGAFTLKSDATKPDLDGKFKLTWTHSLGVESYALYQSSEPITSINSNTIKVKDLKYDLLSCQISEKNGTYYYVVVSYNRDGYTLSNYIDVTVEIPPPPTSFSLSTDAKYPDINGNFNLSWSKSSYAKSYTVYVSSEYIYEINENVTKLADLNPHITNYEVLGLKNGTYHYIVKALNENTFILSNCIEIKVAISIIEPEEEKPFEFNIFGIVIMIIEYLGVFTVLTIWVCTAIIILVLRIYAYQNRPTIFLTSEGKYGYKRLGRLIECYKSDVNELSMYWTYKVRKLDDTTGKKDYTTLYCVHPFELMRVHKWWTLNLGFFRWEMYPHYFVKEVKLPSRLWFRKKELVKTKLNLLTYYLFRLINLIVPFLYFSRTLHKHLEYQDGEEMVKEIKIIQLEYLQERKSFEFYTRFQKKEFFEKEGINAWVQYPELEFISLIHNDKEHFKNEIEEALEEKRNLEELEKKLESFDPETTKKQLITKTMKKCEELKQNLVEIMEKTGLDLDILQFYEQISTNLKENRDKQEKLIKNNIMDEKDKYTYLTLFQIEDLNKQTDSYRRIERRGDPIPKIREIKNFNDAIREASDFRELRSDLSLKLQEKDVTIKYYVEKYHNERETTNKLRLEIQSEVEKHFISDRKEREKQLSGKVAFAAKVVQLVDDFGFSTEDAIIEANREELKRVLGKKDKLLELENKLKEKDLIINKLKEDKTIDVIWENNNKRKRVESLDDIKELKEEVDLE